MKSVLSILVLCLVGVAFCHHNGDMEEHLTEKDCVKGANWKDYDPSSCRGYLECKDGTLTKGSCTWLIRRYDPVTKSCDWWWKVSCATPDNHKDEPPKPKA